MRKSFARAPGGTRYGSTLPLPRAALRLVSMAVMLGTGLAPRRAHAQVVPGTGAAIGSMAADRARVSQITATSDDSVTHRDTAAAFSALLPTLYLAWNSDLPYGGNDAGLWAGRGMNMSLTGGVSYSRPLSRGRLLEVVVSPEIDYSANRAFPIFPGRQPGRSSFSSPWHIGQSSADLPLRFGDLPVRAIGFGQSSITLTTDRIAFGASSTSEWWGPAIRNTLLLSNNAAGVPRLFARTARPLHTRFGDFEGRAIIGGLTESPFFDQNPSNDTRSLSGLLVTYRTALDTGLTLGLSRLVMARASSNLGVLQHAFDVVLQYGPIEPASDTSESGQSYQSTDQLISLFARWIFPASGFESWVEWSRMELPHSLREYLEVPQSTQGYTIGLQWADPHPGKSYFRLQSEVTYLEQTQVIADRPPPDYYTGRAAVQGFTQRGQVLGAAIGPGASSQFLAADWMARTWQAGAFAGRTRTENDALYRQQDPRLERHDVTIYSGLRGGVRLPRYDVMAELTVGRRLNYLFQSDFQLGNPVKAIDVQNVSVTMRLSPR